MQFQVVKDDKIQVKSPSKIAHKSSEEAPSLSSKEFTRLYELGVGIVEERFYNEQTNIYQQNGCSLETFC